VMMRLAMHFRCSAIVLIRSKQSPTDERLMYTRVTKRPPTDSSAITGSATHGRIL